MCDIFSFDAIGTKLIVAVNELKTGAYTFGHGINLLTDRLMLCHKLGYPYAIHFCHTLHNTKINLIPLIVDCHEDTSAWSPWHLAFIKILPVVPGILAMHSSRMGLILLLYHLLCLVFKALHYLST